MKNLLAVFLLAPLALLAQENPNYDPDYNGDGCFTITDVLGLLPLFGNCVDAEPTWACGDSTLFDSYWYETVSIGDQCWFSENLRTTVYADGSGIPEVTGNGAWTGLSSGARCDYDNNAINVATLGRLYNWYAVDDVAGLCPPGWHVPSDGEWTNLENYITAQGFSGIEGSALKSASGWNFGGNGNDDFGFSALPGGSRSGVDGNFYSAGDDGYWWTSSLFGGDAWYRYLEGGPGLFRNIFYLQVGFSVRCLRDAE